jgi:hypothetical protein
MQISRPVVFAACLVLAIPARAEDPPQLPAVVVDVVYKGIVGKALDAVPMDPDQRVMLQRTNAVVSSTLTGRSLAIWAGLTNPLLLIAGLVWGIYAASNIKAVEVTAKPDTSHTETVEPGEMIEVIETAEPGQTELAMVNGSTGTEDVVSEK